MGGVGGSDGLPVDSVSKGFGPVMELLRFGRV